MSKFKVGALASIIGNISGHEFDIGEVVEYHGIKGQWWYSDGSDWWMIDDKDLELITCETTEDPQHDPVSKPSHYNVADGIECIAYIKQVLGNEGFVAYCRGNQIKYQHRAMYKGNPIEDLEKAHQYNAWAIETLKELPDE
tara:strand:- start:509 stop:931 length:423 start_codon:yes stop_codon:yes gene_type:complete